MKGVFRRTVTKNLLSQKLSLEASTSAATPGEPVCRHNGDGNKKEIKRICLYRVGRRTVVPRNIMPYAVKNVDWHFVLLVLYVNPYASTIKKGGAPR